MKDRVADYPQWDEGYMNLIFSHICFDGEFWNDIILPIVH